MNLLARLRALARQIEYDRFIGWATLLGIVALVAGCGCVAGVVLTLAATAGPGGW